MVLNSNDEITILMPQREWNIFQVLKNYKTSDDRDTISGKLIQIIRTKEFVQREVNTVHRDIFSTCFSQIIGNCLITLLL